jgi:hypothetical protein
MGLRYTRNSDRRVSVHMVNALVSWENGNPWLGEMHENLVKAFFEPFLRPTVLCDKCFLSIIRKKDDETKKKRVSEQDIVFYQSTKQPKLPGTTDPKDVLAVVEVKTTLRKARLTEIIDEQAPLVDAELDIPVFLLAFQAGNPKDKTRAKEKTIRNWLKELPSNFQGFFLLPRPPPHNLSGKGLIYYKTSRGEWKGFQLNSPTTKPDGRILLTFCAAVGFALRRKMPADYNDVCQSLEERLRELKMSDLIHHFK